MRLFVGLFCLPTPQTSFPLMLGQTSVLTQRLKRLMESTAAPSRKHGHKGTRTMEKRERRKRRVESHQRTVEVAYEHRGLRTGLMRPRCVRYVFRKGSQRATRTSSHHQAWGGGLSIRTDRIFAKPGLLGWRVPC